MGAAIRKLEELVRGPVPYARVLVHHDFMAMLYHYSVSASVQLRLKGTTERERPEGPMLPQQWMRSAWDFIVASSVPMKEYTYYHDPREQRDEVSDVGMLPLCKEGSKYWKDEISVDVMECVPETGHLKEPCIAMDSADVGQMYALRFPPESDSAMLCAQVILNVQVPFQCPSGQRFIRRVAYSAMPGDEYERRPAGRKWSPFNCDNFACDGVHDNVRRCLPVSLTHETVMTDDGKYALDISATIPRSITIPFGWGESRVQMDMCVGPRGLEGMMEEDGDVGYLHLRNLSFTCDEEILKLSIAELLRYEQEREHEPVAEEALQAAEAFIRRGITK
ncbi:MAG: hypothetical protein GF393_12965 [Armatimonadia bacterium]|nr:hypothetical protein [Armatimonadia bacterium]